jgi:hypothetical protein
MCFLLFSYLICTLFPSHLTGALFFHICPLFFLICFLLFSYLICTLFPPYFICTCFSPSLQLYSFLLS